MIAKKDLLDLGYYAGSCRNASVAQWLADRNEFVYIRLKFGCSFFETIRHPEDDDGYDLFIPVRELSVSDVRVKLNELTNGHEYDIIAGE